MSPDNTATVVGLYFTLILLESIRSLGFNPLAFAIFGLAAALALDVVNQIRGGVR